MKSFPPLSLQTFWLESNSSETSHCFLDLNFTRSLLDLLYAFIQSQSPFLVLNPNLPTISFGILEFYPRKSTLLTFDGQLITFL